MNSLFIEDEIMINAPIDQVWDALTNPSITPKYMYGCKVETNWGIGSAILWIGVEDQVTYVKGNIIDLVPNQKFAYTVIDPNGSYEDIPDNYLTVACTLSVDNGVTHLSVTQGDYIKVADGEKRYADTLAGGGWKSVLESIKKIVEGT